VTGGQIYVDSFCGLVGCDTFLCGTRDSGEQSAINYGGLQDNACVRGTEGLRGGNVEPTD